MVEVGKSSSSNSICMEGMQRFYRLWLGCSLRLKDEYVSGASHGFWAFTGYLSLIKSYVYVVFLYCLCVCKGMKEMCPIELA